MTADDLSAPLGQQQKKRWRPFPITFSQAMAVALSLFLGLFVLWAVMTNNPFGGEPMAVVPANQQTAAATKPAEAQRPTAAVAASGGGSAERYDGPAITQVPPQQAAAPAGNTQTVTIINGKTGQRQEVVIPAPANNAPPADGAHAAPDQNSAELTAHGATPNAAAAGVRPAEAFARPVTPLPGKPDAPRIAIIVDGLGVSGSATSNAIAKLPGAVTLGFMPYGADVAALVARARAAGHEILLQVPMEPFDYPDNDPGPQTLLTTLDPGQNIDRLQWLMGRFQDYVGLTNLMGERFTASEEAFAPVLRETAKRGLIFVDDGTNPRSLASQIATANSVPFAKADVSLDAVPAPNEIDLALGRLEVAAREHGEAVGISSALPVSIDHIVKWAKTAAGRGFLLVPITAVAVKAKQT